MPSGGVRKGAGRPKGSGKYQEPTKAIRLPLSLINQLEKEPTQPLLLYDCKVSAGFPSPAQDDLAEALDLNKYLIKHPATTFLVRVSGHSMINAGIHENDILIVDRSIQPKDSKIVVAAIDGQLTVKRLQIKQGKPFLVAENPAYAPIELREGSDLLIWGVVVTVIHAV